MRLVAVLELNLKGKINSGYERSKMRTLLIAFLIALATQAGTDVLSCKAKNVSANLSETIVS